MTNAVLQQIGITNEIVDSWLKRGLRISYPMLKNKKYYQSEDGFAFVENGDKYVIPLSKKEVTLYIKSPQLFKNNFRKNLQLYIGFIDWLNSIRPKTEVLETKEKFVSLLLILYLFQRAMDYHYFHFDRYLAYQNYPETPVGFWWYKLQKICKDNITLLHLLSNDKEAKKIKKSFNKKQQAEVNNIIKNIKKFEAAQEMEIEKVTDFKSKENRLFRTAIPIWASLTDMLKKYQNLLRPKFRNKLLEIIEGHPLIMTRLILSPKGLSYFQPKIYEMFKNEISRWVNV